MSRQNTPGLGIEYEVHLPAYFALLLNKHSQVVDFTLQSNVEDFGNLDDLLVDIKLKNGEELHFAFQLKHKEKLDKNLLPTNFEAKGDFNLEKYCDAFKKLKAKHKNYHFILYTNKNFDNARMAQVEKFDMIQKHCQGEEFFDTSTCGGNVYKFEVNEKTEDGKNVTKEDYKLFFQQFSLYTRQINFNDLAKFQIIEILKYKEQYLKYVDLFRRWHRGEFSNKTLNKSTVNIHLVDIFLETLIIKNYHISNGADENMEFFESIIKKFDLTVINDSKTNLCDQLILKSPLQEADQTEALIKLAKDTKIIDRSTKELTDDVKLKLLYYFFEKPVIIDFNETSQNLIYETMKLYQVQENRIKFVLVGTQIDTNKFPRLKTFTKLKGLSEIDNRLYKDVFDKCTLSLQGKSEVALRQLIDFEEEIDEIIRPEDVFRMLKPNCLIGEEKEALPKFYIPRTLTTTLIPLDAIVKRVRSYDLVIINFGTETEDFKTRFQRQRIDVIDIEHFLLYHELCTIPFIITTQEAFQARQFAAVCQTQTGLAQIHYLNLVKDDNFVLVKSTGNSFRTMEGLRTGSVDEKYVHRVFGSPISVLCAQPGMGKSTLLKSFKNTHYSNMWTVLVDLKAHNDFLKENNDSDQMMEHFMEASMCPLSKKLKTHLLERRKVVIFLDGLDEIEDDCANSVLEHAQNLASRGFKLWISSRQNLKQKIEDKLQVFVIQIDGLTRNQQEQYINERLRSSYEKEEICEIVTKTFNNADIAKSQQILGVPLQLYIITEIFLSDKTYYNNVSENNFVLTRMYRCFFAGRFEHSLDKTESRNRHMFVGELEDQLEKYEIPALQSLFSDEVFNALQLDLRRSRKFLEKIKASKDPLGIIVKVSSDNKAVFEHLTFAEYFACVFLVENFDKARLLREHIFSERFQNVLSILNIMFGEESPLHLAVIYQDIDQIRKCHEIVGLDKGGRNLLHLAACNDRKLVNLEMSQEEDRLIIEDSLLNPNMKTSSVANELVEFLLQSNYDPLQIDEIFKINSIEYGLASGFLYAVEVILGKIENSENIMETIQKFWDWTNIVYHAVRFGYPKLLSLALSQKCIHPLNKICSNFLQLRSIIDFVLRIDCAKKNEIINILVNNGIITGKICYGFRILQFESIEGDTIVIYFLLKKGCNVLTKFEEPFSFSNTSSVDEDLNAVNAVVITKSEDFVLITLINQEVATNTGRLKNDEGADVIVRNEGKCILALSFRANDLSELNSLLNEETSYDQSSLRDLALDGCVEITFNIFKNWF